MTYSQLKPKVHRSNPLRADRFGEPYAAHIVKDVAQTLLKILDYPHRCHVLSLRQIDIKPIQTIKGRFISKDFIKTGFIKTDFIKTKNIQKMTIK